MNYVARKWGYARLGQFADLAAGVHFFNMQAPAIFPHTIQSLTEELKKLKAEQDKLMELAVYVGMTKEQAQQCDERRKRIYEIYETLFALMTPATQS